MSFLPAHRFEPSDDGDWCNHPRADRVCAQPAEHPIHRPDNLTLQNLAQKLAERQWRVDGPDNLRGLSEHRRHKFNADCAICAGDVHALAAAVIELTRPVSPDTGRLLDTAETSALLRRWRNDTPEEATALTVALLPASIRSRWTESGCAPIRHAPCMRADLAWPSIPTDQGVPMICGNDPRRPLAPGDNAAIEWFQRFLAWSSLPDEEKAATPEPVAADFMNYEEER